MPVLRPVVDQGVGGREARRHPGLVGGERQDEQEYDHHGPGGHRPPCPAKREAAQPGQQRQYAQYVRQHVRQVPEVIPGRRDDREALFQRNVLRVEVEHRPGELAGLAQLVIGLRHDPGIDPEQQGGAEADDALPGEAAKSCGLVGGEADGDAGNQEQQRQSPRVDQAHHRLERRRRMAAFYVPAPGHVEHADVIQDQQAEGDDAQPVEVVASRRRIDAHRLLSPKPMPAGVLSGHVAAGRA